VVKKQILVLPGDGIGPEVTREAVKALKKVAKIFGHKFSFKYGLIGASAIEKKGLPFPPQTKRLSLLSDAVLLGAVGDPRYDDPRLKTRPEQGLLELRKTLGVFANLRPVFTFPSLFYISPLKEEVLKEADLIFVRELTGGIYFGEPRGRTEKGDKAFDTCIYSKEEILKVAKIAFDLAKKRRKKVALVDKANVLATSRLWREAVLRYSKNYPEIKLECLYVDNMAMQLIKNPSQFDVVLTENMFGDILTDEASVISGSLGILPSASLGRKIFLYEPIHGSFPQAKGKGIANPVGAVLSAAMLLEFSFNLKKEAGVIKRAVKEVLEEGFGTFDVVKESPLSTSELGEKIAKKIEKIYEKA